MKYTPKVMIIIVTLILLGGLSVAFLLPPNLPETSENTAPISDESSPLLDDRVNLEESPSFEPIFEPTTILFTGDVMLGRYVETLMNRNGLNYPFTYWSEFDKGHDYTVMNLEGPIVTNHRQTPDFTTQFSFDARIVDVLNDNNVTHITLANNHTLDQGVVGFQQTQQYLEQGGISHFGHQSRSVAEDVVVETLGNQKEVVWIGLNEAVSPHFSLTEAETLVQEFREQYPDAVLILNIHWGDEYQLTSNQKQQTIAHTLADSGADFIIGHHPHVVQEVELYNGVPIFYSLGNTIFDQYFSQDTQEGLLVYLTLDSDWQIEILPIESDMSRPKPMSQERKGDFIQELIERSPSIQAECLVESQLMGSCQL